MSKLLATCAAAAVTAVLAMPAQAAGAKHHDQNVSSMKNGSIEVSSARRHHRVYRHYYHGPRYGYYGGGYYGYPYGYGAYAYDPYYRAPGAYVGIGPFGFGFGW